MGSTITDETRASFEEFIRLNPIDPKYDEECEYLDGDVPVEQLLARGMQEILDGKI